MTDLVFFQRADTSHPVDLTLGRSPQSLVGLRFVQPLNTGHPVDLVFGEDTYVAPPRVDTTVSFNVALPITSNVELDLADHVSFSVLLTPVTSVSLTFDNAVFRGLRSVTEAPFQRASYRPAQTEVTYQRATALPARSDVPWGRGTHQSALRGDRWDTTDRTKRRERSAAWQEATRRSGAPTQDRWQMMDRAKRPTAVTTWQEAMPLRPTPTGVRWQETTRTSRPTSAASWGVGTPISQQLSASARRGTPLTIDLMARWQEGRYPPPGRHTYVPPEPPVVEPCYTPPPGLAVPLLFELPWDGSPNLFFICHALPGPPATVVVPVRRVYMVNNSVSLVRVSDGAPVKTDTLSLQLDRQSWAWGFSASLPASMLDLVAPTEDGPVELLATVNGIEFHVLAENVGRDRAYRSNSLRISGRNRVAELDEDYAARLSFGNTIDRTAQQLMADVLTANGIPLDWTVDWQLEDWLVPAGAWSHYGTYISALNVIAQAAGGYLLPHASAKSFKVLHQYPLAPWQWADAVPDLVLPADVARRESKDWTARPAYNRVFVQGQAHGLLGQVTREGTAGDLVAPQVVDPLITDVSAIRQRGRAELGQGGRQIQIGLGLPVLAETGIVRPGTLVDYTDEAGTVRGLVRSVSVETAFPNVWQTIGVETRV